MDDDRTPSGRWRGKDVCGRCSVELASVKQYRLTFDMKTEFICKWCASLFAQWFKRGQDRKVYDPSF